MPKIWAKTTDAAFKTVSKRVFQKTAEVSNDLMGNRVAVKIKSAASQKTKSKSGGSITPAKTDEVPKKIPRESCIPSKYTTNS